MSMPPSLSVVMPVRDALPYLDAAVESIVGQSFADFEFVILDDASQDGSSERLRDWAKRDSRIRLFRTESSLGPADSSNRVVAVSRGPLVARMDADDIAMPDRLRRQIDLLQRNPDAVLIGTLWEGIDRQGAVVRTADRSRLTRGGFGPPFTHGSILFRRAAFDAAGGYRAECAYWEDLDLFTRMAELGRILVLPEPLYRHRFSETSTRLTSARRRVEEAVDLMFRCRNAYQAGRDYSRMLTAPSPRKLLPETFLSLGNLNVWAGCKPRILQSLLARGALGPNLSTAKTLLWAAWAELSPRSLRYMMQGLLIWRNLGARPSPEGQVAEWRPRLRS